MRHRAAQIVVEVRWTGAESVVKAHFLFVERRMLLAKSVDGWRCLKHPQVARREKFYARARHQRCVQI